MAERAPRHPRLDAVPQRRPGATAGHRTSEPRAIRGRLEIARQGRIAPPHRGRQLRSITTRKDPHMKFGLRLPGAGPYAGPRAIEAFATKAEELGFDSLWMTDHIALPVDIESRYPYREDGKFFWPAETPYLDTILTLAWASAATERIRVGTSVLIRLAPPAEHRQGVRDAGRAQRRAHHGGD